jgi:hypothetical protein
MNYYDKYLKYKNKYLELKNQDGGFIKGDKIEREYTRDTYKFFTEKLDEQMPLCYFDSTKTNFILINNNNYILINKKENDDYELYQLNTDHEPWGIEIDTIDNLKIRFKSFIGENIEDITNRFWDED